MFSEFNSLLFYIFTLGFSAYLLDMGSVDSGRKSFFNKLITWGALGIPVIIGAYHVCGTDTVRYIFSYLEIRKIPFNKVYEGLTIMSELGHKTLMKVMGYLDSVRLYLGVYSLLIVVFMYKANMNFKPQSIGLASFIFYMLFYLGSFNGLRQTLAMVIVAFAYKYVFDRSFTKFFFLVFLASMFHLSAIVAVFAYFIWKHKNERLISNFLLTVVLIVVALISFYLIEFLEIFSGMEFETEKLQSYVDHYGEYTGEKDFNNYSFFVDLFVGIVYAMHYKKLVEVDKKNSFFIYLYFLSIALGLSGFINPYSKRIAWYFKISCVWLFADLPRCYEVYKSKWIWIARFMVIAYVVIHFVVMAYVLGQADIIPYIWYLPSWIHHI